MIGDKGIPGVSTAPYFIIIAELRGIPPAEQESLAHVLENMWLKTTALNLGFFFSVNIPHQPDGRR